MYWKLKLIEKLKKIINNKNGQKKWRKKVIPDTNCLYSIACFCVGVKTKFQTFLLHEDWVEFSYIWQFIGLARDDIPTRDYILKENNRNTKTKCEICSKLTIKTQEHRVIFTDPITKCLNLITRSCKM